MDLPVVPRPGGSGTGPATPCGSAGLQGRTATGDPFEMAANRNSVSQSLTIALITFVMLTFVLAITSYLLYRRGTDASNAAQMVQADSAKAQTEMRKAVDDRSKLLQILGYPDDKAVADIETETTEAFEKRFGDYRDDAKAYTHSPTG